MIYPSEVELALRRFERKCSSLLANYDKLALLPVLAIALLLSYYTKIRIDTMTEQKIGLLFSGQFILARMAGYAFVVLIGFSLASYFVSPRHRNAFNALVLAALWGLNSYLLFFHRLPVFKFTVLVVGLPLLIAATYAIIGTVAKPWHRRLLWIFTIVAGAFYLFEIHMLITNRNISGYALFSKFKLHYVLFLAWTLSLASRYMKIDRSILLNPVNVTKIVLWPPDSQIEIANHQAAKLIWWQGMLNILVGFSLLQFRFVWNSLYFDLDTSQTFGRALLSYIVAIIGDVGLFNIVVGLGRLYGMRARDATNFAWLARSPADYWKRGSVYHYEFIQRFIFVPLLRFTRRQVFVMFASFFVFYCMRNGALVTLVMFLTRFRLIPEVVFIEPNYQRFVLLHFLLQFVLLITTQRWWFRQSRHEGPWMGWLAIASTYFVNAGAIYLAFTIMGILKT